MSDTKTVAQTLAEYLEGNSAKDWLSEAAIELRIQDARIAELEAQLAAIGAGGVEPLRNCHADPLVLPERKVLRDAPEDLNLNDRAFWVLGWNECREAVRDAAIAAQAKQGEQAND